MNGFELARIGLQRRMPATVFAIVCVALATLASSLLVSVVGGTAGALNRIETPFEVMIGPKSSGLGVLLGGLGARRPSVDVLPFALSEYLDRRVFPRHQIPLHACALAGEFPIFGTDIRYLERPENLQAPILVAGRWFETEGEAVVGVGMARESEIWVGQTIELNGLIASVTGETWTRTAKVVGILEHPPGSEMDRTGFVNLETGWDYYRWAHSHGLVRPTKNDEAVTYIWVALEPDQMEVFEQKIHGQSVAQLVKTREEIEYLRTLVEGGRWAAGAFCGAAILLAAAAIGVLANARFESLRPELGLMRALGYSKKTLAAWLVCEGLLVTGLALALSIPLEGLSVGWLSLPYWLGLTEVANPWPTAWNGAVWVGAPVAAVLATILPLLRLYRMDVQTSLKGF